MIRLFLIVLFTLGAMSVCSAQTEGNPNAPKFDSYQIYLKKPVKEIREIKNYKDCVPIKGRISEGQKNIIMENYEPGNKVYLQLIYMDGSEEEFVRSPCYIDPVIL